MIMSPVGTIVPVWYPTTGEIDCKVQHMSSDVYDDTSGSGDARTFLNASFKISYRISLSGGEWACV